MKKKSLLLLTMRISVIQLSLILSLIGNALAKDGHAQELLEKKISLKESNVKLDELLNSIEKLGNFSFVYNTDLASSGKVLSIKVNKQPLSLVLHQLLSPLNLTYEVSNNYVLIKASNNIINTGEKADMQVSGKVTDSQGSPLPGVSVKLKGSPVAVSTDAQGKFSITVPDNSAILVFSFIGFLTVEEQIGTRRTLNIVLKESNTNLNEVVVVGYGSVKRSDLTGAVSSVSSDQITQVKAVSTIAQALQGQAAGVQVIQRSGQPGEAVSIKIRGTNSIAGGNDVLYVVDGLPLDGLSAQLNPSDIASIEVLKDASSTAIYGSRGANGVVMITTKKGTEGKLKISYNGYYGGQSLRKKIDVIGARDFANLQNEANTNWNLDNPTLPQKPIWKSGQIDSLAAQETDWQDLVYKKGAPAQNHDISISGGSAGTKYYSSFGYYNQDGIIANSGFKRYSFRSNLDQKLSQKLNANISLSLQQSNYSQNNYFNADGGGGVPFTTMVMPPTQGVYDANGKYTIFTGVPWGQTNPYAMSNEEMRRNPSLRLIGNAAFSYTILNGLKLKVSAGLDNNWSRTDYYAPSSLSLYTNGGAFQNYSNGATFVNENLLNYTRSFNNHSIDAVGGITYQSTKSQGLNSGTAQGFLTDIYENNNINAASVKAVPGNNYNDNRLMSYLGRVNYTYSSKYIFTLTGRYDGSSRFSQNHKYGFFPSGAFAWRVSEEPFMKKITSVSNLKLRSSYGLAGNQAIGNYQTLPQLNNQNIILNNTPATGYYLSRMPNNDLKWETTKQLDLGIDLGIFNNRVTLTSDYYNKKTTDLLLNVNLPTSSGFSSVLQNVGAVGNKGYEIQLNTKNLTGAFTWSSVLTLSHNRTKILDLGKDAQGNPVTYKEVGSGGNWFPMILGQSMQQLFGYKVLGVYQSDAEAVSNGEPTKKAGDYKFQTSPGGILPNDNRVILSSFEPKFTYGFNNSFAYKNVSLSVLLVGSQGNDIANEFRKYNITLNGKWAPTKEAYENRYIAGKNGGMFERPQTDRNGSTIRDYANSLWLENGSYMRVRDITVAYDIPSSLLKSVRVSSLQIYVSGQNLITVTKYSGYDPEVSNSAATINGWDRGNYPATKGITGGVKVNF